MVITRYLRYAILGLLAAFVVPFASALERPAAYLASGWENLQAPAMVRHQLTLAQWQMGSGVGPGLSTGGMRSESNHFVLATILPELVVLS